MNQYTNYCTEEQTRRAFKLGAPLEIFDPDNSNGVLIGDKAFAIPTTQQMIGWLREVNNLQVLVHQIQYPYEYEYGWIVITNTDDNSIHINKWYENYNRAELAAIDAALDYLEKGESV